ncbi:MAG: hypothetical protein ACFFD2_26745 [Promethearchaeota archaeon]
MNQDIKKYPRYFWIRKTRHATNAVFNKPYPPPENIFSAIPKRFRYSTRNKDYLRPGSRKVKDDYPCIFDYNEVAMGHYIYPRVIFNEETNLYEAIDEKYWGAPLNVGDRTGNWPIEYVTDIFLTDYKTGKPVHVKLPKQDNIKSWLNYKEHQCPTTSIIGAMGSGKSLLICSLENLCLNEEACIMSVDQFFEARHLAEVGQLISVKDIQIDAHHPLPKAENEITKVIVMTQVELWLPEGSEVEFVNKKNIEKPNIVIKYFKEAKDLLHRLHPNRVLAIYDEAFTYKSHNKFWSEIAYYLNRRRNIDDVIDIVHHESSKLLPSHPFKGQFEDVENFSNEYVAFRKAENRVIFGSQLKGENFWRTNQKTIYTMFKAGSSIDSVGNAIMKNVIIHLAIDETLVQYRGRFSLHVIAKFPEGPGEFRILKQNDVEYGKEEEEDEEDLKAEAKKKLMSEMAIREEWINLNKQPQPLDMSLTEWKKEKVITFIQLHIFDTDDFLKSILGVDSRLFNNCKAEAHNRYAEIYLQSVKDNPISFT